MTSRSGRWLCLFAFCALSVDLGLNGPVCLASAQTPAVTAAIYSVAPSSNGGLKFSPNPTVQELERARVFQEPLVPVGAEPSLEENQALAAALAGYARRAGPDDFSSLTGFLEQHQDSAWAPALRTDLGLEYYNTAHYSLALKAWEEAWSRARDASDRYGKAVGDRAAGELAYMYGRLGRMSQLRELLQSVEGRVFVGPATEKIAGAREGLWSMQNRPEVSFRCGPLALERIKLATDPQHPGSPVLREAASTQQGLSLSAVAKLSQEAGMNYQMAFRKPGTAFVVPSVVHWKVGHFAALVRHQGDHYLLEDPTFRNNVWATAAALETETSGYFLVPPGELAKGWRTVSAHEGDTVWGKGNVAGNAGPIGPCDKQSGGSKPCDCPCLGSESATNGPPPDGGMAVSSVHLCAVNLNLRDQPVGYSPPIGSPIRFWVRYNHRDGFQPGTFTYANFGLKWTCDWVSYITDNPQNPLQDVNYYIRGGGQRTFTGFATNTQRFAYQQFDQTLLTRTGSATYEMVWPDGSKLEFAQSDGSAGTSRNIFLSQIIDRYGNTVTLTYDGNLRLVSITDAIGQVTVLTYGLTNDIYKVTQVTDPFGRFATFAYDGLGRLTNITDVIGINSQFVYPGTGDFISSLITPYGTNSFTVGGTGTTRFVETLYPDGSRDRVEFNQTVTAIPMRDSPALVPQGMATHNDYLQYRNTYYWSRAASASSYGDYTKAKIYHWLHTADGSSASGILESVKEPLENRVWYDYAGQPNDSITVGSNNKPLHVGRVLDDGSTQLYTFGYNEFGQVTNRIDPIGRTLSYTYATNGIDLLAVRQTTGGANELLAQIVYDTQHRPMIIIDAAGQTNTLTYNARGQLLTATDPRGETATLTYDANGYLLALDGPLPGTNDQVTLTYDSYGRVRTGTDVSGYTVILDYDAMDRVTRLTHPDGTFEQLTYDRLDPVLVQDRAGRQTVLEYNNMRQLVKQTDPLGRVTLTAWCRCGAPSSLTDPLGRTTSWQRDVQDRVVSKTYGDGSQITFQYERASSRLRQVTDETLQRRMYVYNPDNSLSSIAYDNTPVSTPPVTFTYDTNYLRRVSMTDGIGTTTYSYNPVGSMGALRLAAVSGPWPGETAKYFYDVSGLVTNRSINGIAETWIRDPLGRITNVVNVLGTFSYRYAGATRHLTDVGFPGGQTSHFDFFGLPSDPRLQQLTHRRADSSLISQFTYGYDVSGNVTNWTQQLGSSADTWSAAYDAADRLSSVLDNQGGTNMVPTSYTYDLADNRLLETINGISTESHFNALNELVSAPQLSPTNTSYEWDGRHRLTAIVQGKHRSEFAYDGQGRLRASIEKSAGSVLTERRWIWCGNHLCEERDTNNAVIARFFRRGEQRGGTNLYYFKDHLGSVRELLDTSSALRAEYAFSPYGIKARQQGDLPGTFGFTGLLEDQPSGALFAVHRVYDPRLARWLSRDPLGEVPGLNLFGYVNQNPLRWADPLGYEPESDDPSENVEKAGGIAGDIAAILGPLAIIEHSLHAVEYFAAPLDVFESVVDVVMAIDHPTVKTVSHAVESCSTTLLTILDAPVGLSWKLIRASDRVLSEDQERLERADREYDELIERDLKEEAEERRNLPQPPALSPEEQESECNRRKVWSFFLQTFNVDIDP